MTTRPGRATIVATLQDHRHVRGTWAVATLELAELEPQGAAPPGVVPGAEVDAVGDRLGLAAAGERLELAGRWDQTRYGTQFRVEEQRSLGLRHPRDARRWLERLDGVGPKLANALWEQFGERLPAILSGDEDQDLTQVPGVGEEVARHIRESFLELKIGGDLESIQYLDSIGATRWEASQILAWCAKRRRKPQEVLEGRPYDLMEVKGLGFKRVDRLARAAGCPALAPARVEAAALHCLGEIVQQGSTMVRLASGRAHLAKLVGELLATDDQELVQAGIERLAARGRVVLTWRGPVCWVQPAELLRAERAIYRAATGARPRANQTSSLGVQGAAGEPPQDRSGGSFDSPFPLAPSGRDRQQARDGEGGGETVSSPPSPEPSGSREQECAVLLDLLPGEEW